MKRLKSTLCLLLSAVMVLSLLAGCQDNPSTSTESPESSTPTQLTEPTSEPEPTLEPEEIFPFSDDEELLLAYETGFVPEVMWEDLTADVSLADFCAMLKSIIAGVDAGQVTEFEAYAGKAMTLELPMDRGLASIALYYAADVLDLPEITWFSTGAPSSCWAIVGPELNNIIGDKCWDEIKNKHYEPEYAGVYPRAGEGGEAWDGHWDGDVNVAAYFAMLNRSTYDGRLFFDYDAEANSMHMDWTVTQESAIRAAARFYVMCHMEELYMQSMETANATSVHKNPISEYDTGELVANMTIGIHYNHSQTDWLDQEVGYVYGYDGFYDKMLDEWVVKVSRDNQKAVLKAYREAGFNVIRMPVTWTPYVNDETYEIDEGYLDYIEYQVNLVLDEGMYCIINTMNDYMDVGTRAAYVDGKWVDDWMEPQHAESVNARYAAIWRQVAERFKDYDEHLIFEALNEPIETAFPEGDAYEYQGGRINELNKIFVDTIRSTGSNNAVRTLMLNCLWGQFFLDTLVPPEDDHLVATYHTYFVNEGALGIYNLPNDVPVNSEGLFTEWSRENPTLRSWVEQTFEQIRQFKERTEIPLIIGETSGCVTLSEEENIDLLTYVLSMAEEQGVPVILWDGYWDSADYEGDLGLYHLGRDEWNSQALLDAVMEAVN